MSMIDRYKKKGGFVQLLNLLETTGGEKRDKFLKMIADENAAWEVELKKKMLSLDRICGWNPTFLMEILPRIPIQSLAAIISAVPPEKATALQNGLGFAEKRKIEEALKEKKPAPGEVNSAVMKLMSEIRAMVASGALKFEKFDPDMVVAENIEEQLSSGRPLVSDKDVEIAFASTPAAAGSSPQSSEELTQLRRKIVQISQENQRLQQEITGLKDRLEQIKKIA